MIIIIMLSQKILTPLYLTVTYTKTYPVPIASLAAQCTVIAYYTRPQPLKGADIYSHIIIVAGTPAEREVLGIRYQCWYCRHS